MNITNLTPHSLSLVGEAGATLVVAPSGSVARLSVTRTPRSPVTVGGVVLRVCSPVLGEIVGLPAAEAGTIFVVSALVAEAARREDVMSPGELIRDPAGVPVGAKGLCSYSPEMAAMAATIAAAKGGAR